MATVQERLNTASPNDIADRFRQVSFGDIVQGLIPKINARTGLASSATQVHDTAGLIRTVNVGSALRAIVNPDVTPGAATVQITYDSNGVATLVFNAVLTAYTVTETARPAGLGTTLASEA